jgi:hypothetical protein
MNHFNVRSPIYSNGYRTWSSVPTIRPFHVADLPPELSHKTRSVLIGSPHKLLGRVLGVASLRVDPDHHQILNLLYQIQLNSPRRVGLI